MIKKNRFLFSAVFWLLFSFSLSFADVVTDGSVGASTALSGPDYNITEDIGRRAGNNLFHSFRSFDIGTGETALFSGSSSIRNVIGRVTGGTLSRIDGTIRCTIPGADLFLMNPSGMLFGSGAAVDVQGSFHVATADVLTFESGESFYAAPSSDEILSSAPPSAFGFLSEPTAEIRFEPPAVESDPEKPDMSVPDGETFTITAGKISIGKSINAPSGRISITSVSSPCNVPVSESPKPSDMADMRGEITIEKEAVIKTNGDGNGRIHIIGGRFFVDNALISNQNTGSLGNGYIDIDVSSFHLMNGGAVSADNFGEGKGADIHIQTQEDLEVSGSDFFGQASSITAASREDASGEAGNIHIKGKHLHLEDGASITCASFGAGNGGNIDINTMGGIFLTGLDKNGNGSLISASSEALEGGSAGNISMTASSLSMTDGAMIETVSSGSGRGGDIRIQTGSSVSLSGVNGDGTGSGILARSDGDDEESGDGGNVSIICGNLSFSDGGWIGNTSEGGGNGGDVEIRATGSVSFSGTDGDGYASRLYTSTRSTEPFAGNAGNIDLFAENIRFSDGGGISAETLGPGNGGTITIDCIGDIEFTGGNPHGENRDGFGSGIFSRSLSDTEDGGNAGNIRIEARNLSISEGAVIKNGTMGGGSGGNVFIDVSDTIWVSGDDEHLEQLEPLSSQIDFQSDLTLDTDIPDIHYSAIHSISENDSDYGGNSGTIEIHTKKLAISEGGEIATSTFGGGNAGNVTVSAENIDVFGRGSGLFAASNSEEIEAGSAGDIEISADSIYFSNGGWIGNSTYGGGSGGTVSIQSMDDVVFEGYESGILSFSGSEETDGGDAGNIHIDGRSISLLHGAWISSSTIGGGKGGNISLDSNELVTLSGIGNGRSCRIFLGSENEFSGDAGTLEIRTGTLELADGALIDSASDGSGKGGDINVNATDNVRFQGWGESGVGSGIVARSSGIGDEAGNGGTISIYSEDIEFENGGWIGNTSEGSGNGGDVTIFATGAVRFSGTDANGDESKIYTSANYPESSAGNAGNITISAENVDFLDGGGVTAGTEGTGTGGDIFLTVSKMLRISGNNPNASDIRNSGVFSRSTGTMHEAGNAGKITLQCGEIRLDDGGEISTETTGTGQGGMIAVHSENMRVSNGSAITSASRSEEPDAGNAGSIQATADESFQLMNGGKISTEAVNAGGGKIGISVGDTLYLLRSEITTSVRIGSGNGGDIDMDTRFVVLNAGDIIARAYEGNGGNIHIGSDHFIRSLESHVDASSKLGIDGSVAIESPVAEFGGELSILSADFLDAEKWLSTPCSGRSGENVSRLVVRNMEASPIGPDDCLQSIPFH